MRSVSVRWENKARKYSLMVEAVAAMVEAVMATAVKLRGLRQKRLWGPLRLKETVVVAVAEADTA